ncbi:uncharacterized protein LOC131255436 isoform X4 [Magnolia sinica]|uniref:uncharacterized protein LOC131255436 isoform X4 n=1 Tax=Magnolia sinica TaxID=86752 RepID=UPI002657E5D1|nr:uncharacterized protein LOC131255436 isoform X4 [Magnolia sinica]
MLIRSMIPSTAQSHPYHRLSLRTFIKRLPLARPVSPSSTRRTITSISVHSSHLETLTPRQKEQISLYVDALLQWNQRMNLTAVTETGEVMKRHVDDSLAIIPPIKSSYLSHCGSSFDHLNLIDVGSGPGLPGLIFAIAFPGWKVTLLESMHKRCLFLEHAVGLTGLSNVQVLRARAEEEVRSAKKAIQFMGASVLQLCSVESDGPHGQRTAVVCLKDRPTPQKYPRHPGIPAKSPL